MKKNYNLGDVQTGEATGMDAFFASEPKIITPTSDKTAAAQPARKPGRVKVGSLQQLNGFDRVSAETLIHRSTQDLWTLRKEADGEFYIERLFQDDAPIKG